TAPRLLGYPAETLLTKSLAAFYDLGDDTLKSEFERGLARRHGIFVGEGWRPRQDGSKFWGEMTLTALRDENGSLQGFSCHLIDITERKTAEIALRQSEERYRLMVEAVKDYAIFMLDPTGHILTWNEGARRTKGYLADEIIGKHFSTFYTGVDLEDGKPARELRIAIQTGKYEEEGWRVKKNGSVFWANVVITALYNEVNKLIGFAKVTRDLSERREAEESLRQSEERYRSLVHQVTDYGIFMMDEKGRIISWNEGARRIKGYEADEIIGKYFSIFYPEEDILNGKPAHELKVARTEGKYEEEGWRLRKDGSLFWANVVITAVYNTHKILIGFSKVTRDLTERREAERALRDSYDRYRTLANELRVTNDELSYANEELEQFTSIVSHDLQEPIRTIKSFLMLIDQKLGSEGTEDLKSYVSKSIGAATRMRELIQNLLQYSQLSRGEMVLDDVNVEDILNEALQNLRTSIKASGATITIENEADTVRGDRVQLVQLVQNLLSNALKFTASDEPAVVIRTKQDGKTITVAIQDNGIGIAAADLGKVFEIFRRLSSGKSYPGTGIGLAICKKIVDRHHGRIWPESGPGAGTTFYFTLNENMQNNIAS
ncbi:MAG: domain S-box protein, partial [Flaviaesturariibacter sp.]|nr:domain S-box protein [Flaviaesturariibacter sp.]